MSYSNRTRVSADAPETGDFSLELSTVEPTDLHTYYNLYLTVPGEDEEQISPLCTVCLRTAVSFIYPVMQREDPAGEENETQFMCHSRGGFPRPTVLWLINGTEPLPKGSTIRTVSAPLSDSPLYNVTSHLTVNVSQNASVSCTIENPYMNESLTSTIYGVHKSPAVGTGTDAMWIISTVLTVLVGVAVMASLVYQIRLDRTRKRLRQADAGSESCEEDRKPMKRNEEVLVYLTETNI
ncbi:ICOS ligand-like [Aplochiton taeniatus]